MRMGLRRGVGSSFSLASRRLRRSADDGVFGAARGASSSAYTLMHGWWEWSLRRGRHQWLHSARSTLQPAS